MTQTPLKTVDELRCSGRVSSSCSTSYVFLYFKMVAQLAMTKDNLHPRFLDKQTKIIVRLIIERHSFIFILELTYTVSFIMVHTDKTCFTRHFYVTNHCL